MIPACYDNFFAFRPDQTCTTPIQSVSGLYIDDLEGVSLMSASSTGKHTYNNAQAVLNAKTQLVLQKCESWVQEKLIERGFMLPQKQVAQNLCKYATTIQSASILGRGVTLLRDANATFLSNLYIDKVSYKAANGGTAFVVVQDLSGIIIFTSPSYIVNANIPLVVSINAYYAIDVRVLVVTNTTPFDTDCSGHCACLCAVSRNNKQGEQMYRITGFDGLADATSGYGVTVCAALRCNIQALMCYILDTIKMPMLYMVGAEILKEVRQLNAPTAQSIGYYSRDIQKETIDAWQKEANRLLSTQVDTIIYQLRELDHYCISCNTPKRIKILSLR